MYTCPLLFYHYPIQLIYLPLTRCRQLCDKLSLTSTQLKQRKAYFLPTIMSSKIKGRLSFISIFNIKLKIFLILLKTHHTCFLNSRNSVIEVKQQILCRAVLIIPDLPVTYSMEFSQKSPTAPHVATKSKTNHTFLSTHLKLSLTKLTY